METISTTVPGTITLWRMNEWIRERRTELGDYMKVSKEERSKVTSRLESEPPEEWWFHSCNRKSGQKATLEGQKSNKLIYMYYISGVCVSCIYFGLTKGGRGNRK